MSLTPMLTDPLPAHPVDADGVGVDRLSLSFPVSDLADPSSWDTHSYSYATGRHTFQKIVRDESNDKRAVMVGVQTVNGELWGKVEANPARFSDPDGCSLLPLHDTRAAAAVMLTAAGTLLDLACDPGESRVKRVDVARDFRGVQVPGIYVRGLLNVKRSHARRTFLYADPGKGNAETLYAGSNAGGVRLYDQHAAYAEKGAPEGSLRWEVEARQDWLEKHDIQRLEDMDPDRLLSVAHARWEWSRMGTGVTGACNVVEAVQGLVRAGFLSQAKADRALGQLTREALGVAAPVAKATQAEYQRIKDRLGIVPTAELLAGDIDVTVAGRLDFATGTEICS